MRLSLASSLLFIVGKSSATLNLKILPLIEVV